MPSCELYISIFRPVSLILRFMQRIRHIVGLIVSMTNLISWSSINLGTGRGSTFLKSLLPRREE
jgi:hypothetical protein